MRKEKETVVSMEGVYALSEVPERPHPFCGCQLEPVSLGEIGVDESPYEYGTVAEAEALMKSHRGAPTGQVPKFDKAKDFAASNAQKEIYGEGIDEVFDEEEEPIVTMKVTDMRSTQGVNKSKLKSVIDELPEDHLQDVKISLVDRVQGARAAYLEKKNQIIVEAGEGAKAREVSDAVVHEIGHNYFTKINKVSKKEWASLSNDTLASPLRANEFKIPAEISDRTKAQKELFGYAYEMYVRNSEKLKSTYPKLYKFFKDRIFYGVEY